MEWVVRACSLLPQVEAALVWGRMRAPPPQTPASDAFCLARPVWTDTSACADIYSNTPVSGLIYFVLQLK